MDKTEHEVIVRLTVERTYTIEAGSSEQAAELGEASMREEFKAFLEHLPHTPYCEHTLEVVSALPGIELQVEDVDLEEDEDEDDDLGDGPYSHDEDIMADPREFIARYGIEPPDGG